MHRFSARHRNFCPLDAMPNLTVSIGGTTVYLGGARPLRDACNLC
jgi:hypothetical protein